MRISPPYRIFFVLALGLLSLGTVTKKHDPILATQTEPVSYQEKQKEEAEGKKGPPAPSLELFPKRRFLVEGPMEKMKIPPAQAESKKTQPDEFWLEEGSKSRKVEEDGEFKLELETDDIWGDTKESK